MDHHDEGYPMTDEELEELIRRWKLIDNGALEVRQTVGPTTLYTAIPLLEELLAARKVLEALAKSAETAHREVGDLVSLILKAHNDPEDAANILSQVIDTREDAHGSWRVVDIDKLRGMLVNESMR
jgi:hypothetical protein